LQEFPGDKSFSRSFQDLENLKIKFQDFPGVSRSCTNPAVIIIIITNNRSPRVIKAQYWMFGKT
jgi:hypothetical protein